MMVDIFNKFNTYVYYHIVVLDKYIHSNLVYQYSLFNLFAATLHKGGRSSIRNLRTRHALVTTEFIDKDCTVILLCVSLLSQEPD